jgi:hypothetical protein
MGHIKSNGKSANEESNKYYCETEYNQYIRVYSFALNPEEHQPSGTYNFSRINKAILTSSGGNSTTPGVLKVFTFNYDILRIMSDMGGLAYSN